MLGIERQDSFFERAIDGGRARPLCDGRGFAGRRRRRRGAARYHERGGDCPYRDYSLHCSARIESATKAAIRAASEAVSAERRYDSPSVSALPDVVAATTRGANGPVGTARR